MKNRITKSEALAFRKRWRMINDAERKELRAPSSQLTDVLKYANLYLR